MMDIVSRLAEIGTLRMVDYGAENVHLPEEAALEIISLRSKVQELTMELLAAYGQLEEKE